MATAEPLASLLQNMTAGDESAAEAFLRDYGPLVLRAVRFRLSEKLRRDFESVDLVQAVWQSFFGSRRRLEDFQDPKAFCAFLVRMAERKVQMAARKESRLKRGGTRRQQFDSTIMDSPCMAGRESTPSQLAIAAETWDRLIGQLSARDQKILCLRNLGFSRLEIAEKLSIADSTVRRVLDQLKSVIGKST
jgi:RNA polymerase sigma factor (sigma-70 family)